MKNLGIIGGIGPESTVDYYHSIIEIYRAKKPDGSYPPIIINSIDVSKVIAMVTANDWPALTNHLVHEVGKLARAGADFGLISANTPHIVFPEVQRRSPIPLISIVEATCQAAKSLHLKRVGLLGTRFTMQGKFYPDVFSHEEIALVVPDLADQDYIHDKYMNELLKGVFLPETRERLLAIIDDLKQKSGIQGLILGGTELPLILRAEGHDGIPFLDTTRIHVEAAVVQMLS